MIKEYNLILPSGSPVVVETRQFPIPVAGDRVQFNYTQYRVKFIEHVLSTAATGLATSYALNVHTEVIDD